MTFAWVVGVSCEAFIFLVLQGIPWVGQGQPPRAQRTFSHRGHPPSLFELRRDRPRTQRRRQQRAVCFGFLFYRLSFVVCLLSFPLSSPSVISVTSVAEPVSAISVALYSRTRTLSQRNPRGSCVWFRNPTALTPGRFGLPSLRNWPGAIRICCQPAPVIWTLNSK